MLGKIHHVKGGSADHYVHFDDQDRPALIQSASWQPDDNDTVESLRAELAKAEDAGDMHTATIIDTWLGMLIENSELEVRYDQ